MNLLSNPKSKTFKRKRSLGILTIVFVISFGFLSWKINSTKNKNRDLTDYTIPAELGALPGLITASGELQAIRSVNVSPERQGILQELLVKEGDQVEKGELIARMKGRDYLYRLNELKAEFNKQKTAFERRKLLFAEGAISAEQFDDYRNRFLTSKARLKQREVEGNELMIRAPFKGIITKRYADPGAYVAPTTRSTSISGATSASIVELSQGLEVNAKVPESDIGRIKIGQNASIRVDAFPDKKFKAKVNEIAPRASKEDNVTSFEVTLTIESSTDYLLIGMTADVDFETGESPNLTLVPTVSIVTENGKPGVLIVGEKGQPKFQKVELGNSSGSQTAIINGISPNDLIFIDLPPWAKQKNN